MSQDQILKIAYWAFASTFGVIGSFLYSQVQGTDLTTIAVGAVGLVGLVGLIWKLVTDYRSQSDLVDDYREALKDERDENARLRDEIAKLRNPGSTPNP